VAVVQDVFEVDGVGGDQDERLTRLSRNTAAGVDQAVRIAREGARFNIGAVDRTVNTPVLPLLFPAEAQSR
jgi:hypothetical protein